jgi:hypothetical protein
VLLQTQVMAGCVGLGGGCMVKEQTGTMIFLLVLD